MSSMIRPQTFPIFQKEKDVFCFKSHILKCDNLESSWNFLTVNFLYFHLRWEVKTYAEVKVGDFHAVSKFPLGHYAQGETRNVGCKEKQKILIMSSLKHSVWKSPKMSHLNFFFFFGIFNEFLSPRNVNVARFARNVECDFLGDFQTLWCQVSRVI